MTRKPRRKRPRKLKLGDIVSCHGRFRRVVGVYGDIPGGVILDEPVGLFHSWHQSELTFVRHASRKWLDENSWRVR